MPVAAFDTLKDANTLKAAGVPDKQAESSALAEALQVNLKELTNKEDAKALEAGIRADLKASEAGVRADMKASEDRLTAKIQLATSELKSEIAVLRNEVSQLKWLFRLGLGMGLAMLYRLFFLRGPV